MQQQINIYATKDKLPIDLASIPVLDYGNQVILSIEIKYDNGVTFTHNNYVHSGKSIAYDICTFYISGFKELLKFYKDQSEIEYYYGFKKIYLNNKLNYTFAPDGQSNFHISDTIGYTLNPENNTLHLKNNNIDFTIQNGVSTIQNIIIGLQDYVMKLKNNGYIVPQIF